MSERQRQKELKSPDAFQKVGVEASSWLETNQRLVITAILGVVGVGFLAAVASHYTKRGDTTAGKELAKALSLLERPVVSAGSNLEGVDVSEPSFKSETEKDTAFAAELSALREKQKGTPTAAAAALPLGQVFYRQGKYDEALAAFEEYLRGADAKDPLRTSALEGVGYAHEAKKELDQAAKAFDQMAREGGSDFLKGMGLYHRGRILVQQGRLEEGAKQFADINAAAPGSSASRLAAERLSQLAAKGVFPPVPVRVDAGIIP